MEDVITRKVKFKQHILSKLHDESNKKFLELCMEDFPNYFWIAPSSGTGKYHPEDEFAEGGLVLHTRRVIKIAEDLCTMYELSYYERDVLLVAATLHDSWSKGLDSDTINYMSDSFHPLYPAQMFPFNGYSAQFIPERTWEDIMGCVVSHMGRWSVNKWLNIDKKLPNLLKIADYMASRRHIKVEL